MKYTTDQLGLIASLFKIQFSDKTVGDFFPNHWNELEKNIRIGEMNIGVSMLFRDINFVYNNKCIFWFFVRDQCMCSFYDLRIPIADIVKMLSFEDKV